MGWIFHDMHWWCCRYSMRGNSSGAWDLVISRADVSDEGLYQCQILASSLATPLRTDYASLTVHSRPQPPVMTSGPRLAAREGARVLVQCISKAVLSRIIRTIQLFE